MGRIHRPLRIARGNCDLSDGRAGILEQWVEAVTLVRVS